MAKVYWKFRYPAGTTYSPDWFGNMAFCPKNVTVLLQNDKEGWGIAYCEAADWHNFKGQNKDEILVITEAESSRLLNLVKDSTDEKVYFGEKLVTRWEVKPEEVKPFTTLIRLSRR
jgi:hypothetical protein